MKVTYRLYATIREDKMRIDNLVPVYLFLRIGSITKKIPTGKFVMVSEWNKHQKTAKTNSPKGMALAAFLNRRINDFNAFILSNEAMGKEATMNLAMKFFETSDQSDFYVFFEEQLKQWQNRSKHTLKGYRTLYNILKEISPNLVYGDIDYAFVEKLEYHLAVVRKNSENGRFTKHKNLRCMINQAIKKRYMKENPYEIFKLKEAKGNRVALTIDEIKKVIDLELPERSGNLNHIRDMFVFGCLTGLRFSDVIGLKFGDIKTNPDSIEIKMQKTSKTILIPLLPKAKEIIVKYRNGSIQKDDKNVFKNIANQTVNKKLKELMKMSGIQKHISFHSSRHSFATSLLHSKVSLPHIQKLLGHASYQDTLIYAHSLAEDLFESMESLENMYTKQEAV